MARTIAERHDVIPVLAEVFRAYGYEGASLARITEGTGLGKGSLYHFFPGGKQEMASAVLAHIDAWFQENVFTPLRQEDDPERGISRMFAEVRRYFLSGRKVCLLGVFALGGERDRFADQVASYFRDWTDALGGALMRAGKGRPAARDLAEEIVGGIQGGLVMARAWNDASAFTRQVDKLEKRALTSARVD